ncbi:MULTISPECIES: GDSL-type esterase/lipase family protein [Cryobacterium]|nr:MULTISPECIES: GDSL-type esterase/lipase family protein [Cryobacterium]
MSGSVVFMGGALTASGQWAEWLPEYEVRNFGVSGYTTDEVVAGVDAVIELEPDAVVVGAGTNDLGWRRSDEYIVRNLETVICALRKGLPGARLLVVSVPPRERDFANTLRSINRHLRQFVPTQHAAFLDLWPRLAQPDGEIDVSFSDDRLHLNADGYAAWASELQAALEAIFERPPSSTAIPISHV